MKKRLINLRNALITLALLAAVVWLAFGRQADGLTGSPGNVFAIGLLGHFLLVGLGMLCILLRMLRLGPLPAWLERLLDPFNNPGRFFYILLGCGNMVYFLAAAYFYISGSSPWSIFQDFWPHLALGAVMLGDSLLIPCFWPGLY